MDFTINDIDVYLTYGAFLAEERKGGRNNLNAILKASKVKEQTGVDIRENNGSEYPEELDVQNLQRDLTLTFAITAATRAEWIGKYTSFIQFLKNGHNGWLTMKFPTLGNFTIRCYYLDTTDFSALTYIWLEGQQAALFKVTFREPQPTI